MGDNIGVVLIDETLQEWNQNPGGDPCSVNQISCVNVCKCKCVNPHCHCPFLSAAQVDVHKVSLLIYC